MRIKKKPFVIHTSTNKFIDVVAQSKKEAINFVGKKGKFKEVSARRTKKEWGVYVFYRL